METQPGIVLRLRGPADAKDIYPRMVFGLPREGWPSLRGAGSFSDQSDDLQIQ